MADVALTFTGNSADAERAIVNLERKYLALEEKIKRTGKKGQEGAGGVVSALQQWANKTLDIAAGYAIVNTAIGTVMETNTKFIQQADEAAMKYDKLFRGLRIQTGLKGPEVEKKVKDLAIKFAVPIEQAEESAKFLIGGGMSQDDATGKGYEAFQKGLIATNSTESPQLLADAMTGYAASQGEKVDHKIVDEMSKRMFALYGPEKIQMSSFKDFAAEAAVYKGTLSKGEQLSGLTALLKVGMSSAEASTAERNVVSDMMTAEGDKKKSATLRSMGIEKGGIDLVGESFDEALGRLEKGLASLPEADRAAARVAIFGDRGQNPAQVMMNSRGMMRQWTKLQDDMLANPAAYDKAVAVGTSGPNAARQRIRTEKEWRARNANEGFTDKLDVAGMELEDQRGGKSLRTDLENSVRRGLANTMAVFGGDFGVTAGYGMDIAGGAGPQYRQFMGSSQQQGMDPQTLDLQKKQLLELQKLNKKQRPAVQRNAQGE